MTDMDLSNPKDVKIRAKGAKHEELKLKSALTGIMKTEEGRAWLHSILIYCAPFHTPFSRDPIQMAFNCGQQDIGLWLIAQLHEASDELYLVMMKENKDG